MNRGQGSDLLPLVVSANCTADGVGVYRPRRLFEVDPLACPRCRGLMRIVAVITEPAVISQILAHWPGCANPAGSHA